MADFITMAAQYLGFIYTILALGMSLAIYLAYRVQINFWWLNVWYSVPVIGKLARLSKDTTHSSNPGWLRAEETLCGDFRKHIHTTTEVEFRKRLVYMSKAQDLGRKPLPGWLLGVLAVLLGAEGLGFSYLLGTWMAREGSANVHTVLMLAIVFVICTVMLFLTHSAGHQLYRTGLIRRCDKAWRDGGQEGKLYSGKVMLDADQSEDDGTAWHTQALNRVGETGSYAMVAITIAAIVAIAGISTWMRISNLNQTMIQETVSQAGSSAAGNPFATGDMPAELAKPQQEADMKARAEALSSEKSEGFAAFIMLAVIFTVTQVVGIYAGYKYGFAGKESGEAFKGMRGFSTYDDYMNHVEPMIHAAQAKLQTLQRKLAALPGNVKLNLTKSFDDYLRESDIRRMARRRASAAANAPVSTVRGEVPTAAPVNQPPATLAEALQRIAQLGSSADKIAFVASLPDALRAEIVQHRRAEKAREEEEARKAREQELSGLF